MGNFQSSHRTGIVPMYTNQSEDTLLKTQRIKWRPQRESHINNGTKLYKSRDYSRLLVLKD